MQRGYIVALNRASATAHVQLYGGAVVPAQYLTTGAPMPRSVCWVEQIHDGMYVLVGTEGDVREVVHDDFTLNLPYTAVAGRCLSDTSWTNWTAGAGSTFGPGNTRINGYSYGAGIVDTFSDAVLNSYSGLSKDPGTLQFPSSGLAWFSWLGTLSTLTGTLARVGFGDNAGVWQFGLPGVGTKQVTLEYDASSGVSTTNWILVTRFNGNTTQVVSSSVAHAEQFIWIDVLIRPGVWALAYVDGQQVAQSTSNIPDAATGIAPGFAIFNRAAAARTLRTDACVVAIATACEDPP